MNGLDVIKTASDKAASLLDEVCKLIHSINEHAAKSSNQLETASNFIDAGVQNQDRLVKNLASDMERHFFENQKAIEHFTHQEIKREERTGGTPQRRTDNNSSNETLSPIPTKVELLKQMERTPQRESFFKIRDSLLGQNLPDSPATVKTKLPSTIWVNKVDEEVEKQD